MTADKKRVEMLGEIAGLGALLWALWSIVPEPLNPAAIIALLFGLLQGLAAVSVGWRRRKSGQKIDRISGLLLTPAPFLLLACTSISY